MNEEIENKIDYNPQTFALCLKKARSAYKEYRKHSESAKKHKRTVSDMALQAFSMGVTLKSFSTQVGIQPTTMANWRDVRIKELSEVVKSIRVNEGDKLQEKVLEQVLAKIDEDTTSEQAQQYYESRRDRSTENKALDNAVIQLSRICFNVTSHFILFECDQDTLKTIQELTAKIQTYIMTHFGKDYGKASNSLATVQ